MIVSDIKYLQKMDRDTDLIHLDAAAVRKRVNMRINNKDGADGSNEDLIGTMQVYYFFSPYVFELVGWCPDISNNAVFLFFRDKRTPVGSDVKEHKIVRYYFEKGTVEEVIVDELLNFQEGYWINANVVDGMLYWTDGYFESFGAIFFTTRKGGLFNPPRKVNVTKALNMGDVTVPSKEKYSEITFDLLDVAKMAHLLPPTAEYYDDSTRLQNFLRGKLFQFRVQYIYDDGEKSVWSPISKVPLPPFEDMPDGSYLKSSKENNAIALTFNSGPENVVSIKLAYREGNYGHWKQFKTIEKFDTDGSQVIANNTLINHSFYNDSVSYVLDQDAVNVSYWDIPLVAKTQEFINGSNLVYGNYLKDFSNIEIDIALSLTETLKSYPHIVVPSYFILTSQDPYVVDFTVEGLSQYYVHGNMITMYIKYKDGTEEANEYEHNMFYILKDTDTASTIADVFADLINDRIEEDFAWNVNGILSLKDRNNYVGVDFHKVISVKCKILRSFETIPTFKSGSVLEVGIVYSDRIGRFGGVNLSKDESNVIKIPFISEKYAYQITDYPSLYQNLVSLSINHLPPIWATHYHVYVHYKIGNFFQYMVDPVERDLGKGICRIKLNQAIQEGLLYSELNYSYYSFKKGDRVRFLYVGNWEDDQYRVIDQYLDMEILRVEYDSGDDSFEKDDSNEVEGGSFILDENGNKIKKDSVQYLVVRDFDYYTRGLNRPSVVEVYTPQKDDQDKVFHAIGETFEIGGAYTSLRYHKGTDGNDQNITNSTPAVINLTGGNAYIRPRIRNTNRIFLCEDSNFSDIFESNTFDVGRVNAYLETSATKWFPDQLKHSNKYVADGFNGLSEFDSSFIKLSSKYGGIIDLSESGYILKVKQRMKDVSIYIGRVVINQAGDGQGQLATTDKLLGSVMPSQLDYGTIYPKSVVNVGTHQYYFDVYNGCMIRDSYNGAFPISDYGMKSYFKETSEMIIKYGVENTNVCCGWDGLFNELIVTFVIRNQEGTLLKQETVVFHEPDNTWSHFAEFYPEGYAYFLNFLVGYDGKGLFLHNKGIINNLYGSQKTSMIEVIINKEPFVNKIYQNLVLKGTSDWACPNYTDVVILDELGNEVMMSKIELDNFIEKQDVRYANFKRNALNAEGNTNQWSLVNGSRLRGRLMRLRVWGSSTVKSKLSYLVVNSLVSHKV